MHTNLYDYWDTGAGKYVPAPYELSLGLNSFIASGPYYTVRTFKITTPAVLAAAQTSFGCATLEGLELGQSGSLYIPGSNWDKRYMYNDILAKGFDSENTVISPMTWAMFLDTGWYTHLITPHVGF